MRTFISILIISVLFAGCKKKADPVPDYNCDCQPYGKNALSLLIKKGTSLYPYKDDKSRWGFIDENGTVVIAAAWAGSWSFSNNRAMVIEDTYGVQYAGFIDATGAVVVPTKYRLIADAYYSTEGLIPMGDVHTWLLGYIDMTGRERVPFQFANGSNFHEGLATIFLSYRAGAIDVNGNMVIPNKYLSMSIFSEGLAYANKSGEKRGYITPRDEYKFQGDFIDGTIFLNGMAAVDDPITELIGFIDSTGQFIISPKFNEAGIFSEGLAGVKLNGKWGFINTSGNFAIPPQFEDVYVGFCNGLAPVKQNGQWGYIDRDGKMTIEPQFDDADIFYCNIALVLFTDGTFGYVNKAGKIVYRSKTPVKSKSGFKKMSNALHNYNIRIGI